MSPFEALYGGKCNTSVSWDNPTDKALVRPTLLKEMEEHMKKIKHNFKAFEDLNKIYAENNIVFRYFKMGEHVFLKVKAKRRSLRLGSFP